MSVTFLLSSKDESTKNGHVIDFCRSLPGLRDRWIHDYAGNDFSVTQITIPRFEVTRLYAGLCALCALRPVAHPAYPELNDSSVEPEGGYWFLIRKRDCDATDEDAASWYSAWREEFLKQHEIDRCILSQLVATYTEYIAPVRLYELGSDESRIDVFYFDLLKELRNDLKKMLRSDDAVFTAHV